MDEITGYYSSQQYYIAKGTEVIYTAGNSALDSQIFLTSKEGIGIVKMKEYCEQTANQMAVELNLEYAGTMKIEEEDEP
jgi:hypothetical protein